MDSNMFLLFLIVIGTFGLVAGLYYMISPFKRRSANEFVMKNKIFFIICSITPLIFGGICIYLLSEVEGTDIIVLILSCLMISDCCFIFDLAVRRAKEKAGSFGLAILFYLFGATGCFLLYSVLAFWGY